MKCNTWLYAGYLALAFFVILGELGCSKSQLTPTLSDDIVEGKNVYQNSPTNNANIPIVKSAKGASVADSVVMDATFQDEPLLGGTSFSGFMGDADEHDGDKDSRETHCKIVIVGGGAAGMYSFFRLAPIHRKDVCIFEKNNYFGGRINDIDSPNGQGKWADGAVRVMQGQTIMFNLANELGITLEAADYLENRVFARGVFHGDTNDYIGPGGPYPLVPVPDFPDWSCMGADNYSGCYSDAYYQQIFRPAPPPPGETIIECYAPTVIGEAPFQFLKDSFRFRGDFLSAIDARSYVDFLREDWDACCTPSYPVGGMSAFILGMLNSGRSNGGRAYSSEPVLSINKHDKKYILETSKRRVIADKIIIAAPPNGLDEIQGTIAEQIKEMGQFQDIQPLRVVTIENWWSVNWWNDLIGEGGSRIDRAWATPEAEFKFNFTEFWHSSYQEKQFAVRTVYDDDPRTISLWAQAFAKGGNNGINNMIVSQLNQFFGITTIRKSDITQTSFRDWPNAWHWLRKGTSFTNAQIAIWAVNPICDENVSLAGDAYNPNRTTWTDGAIKSAINTLNKNFGLGLKCATVVPAGNGLKYVPFNSPEYDCPETTAVAKSPTRPGHRGNSSRNFTPRHQR